MTYDRRDLDRYLMDEVFQPLVDRTGIDPGRWADGLFHAYRSSMMGTLCYWILWLRRLDVPGGASR